MNEIDNRLDEIEDEIEALQLVIKRAQDELARLNAEHHRLCDGEQDEGPQFRRGGWQP
jgi:predicted nuclease with TOPRIM domain